MISFAGRKCCSTSVKLYTVSHRCWDNWRLFGRSIIIKVISINELKLFTVYHILRFAWKLIAVMRLWQAALLTVDNYKIIIRLSCLLSTNSRKYKAIRTAVNFTLCLMKPQNDESSFESFLLFCETNLSCIVDYLWKRSINSTCITGAVDDDNACWIYLVCGECSVLVNGVNLSDFCSDWFTF